MRAFIFSPTVNISKGGKGEGEKSEGKRKRVNGKGKE
jgi:hypothetical protein